MTDDRPAGSKGAHMKVHGKGGRLEAQWALTLALMALSYMYLMGWAVAASYTQVGLTDLTP
jgi:uncharacterized membrane protein YhdT